MQSIFSLADGLDPPSLTPHVVLSINTSAQNWQPIASSQHKIAIASAAHLSFLSSLLFSSLLYSSSPFFFPPSALFLFLFLFLFRCWLYIAKIHIKIY
jgi:hypothetical protein